MTDPPQGQINALIDQYNSGHMANAEQACRELLQTYPRSLVVINILGAVQQGQGKLLEAVTSYEKAIQIQPDFAEAYSNRGGVLQELGQPGEAVESCNKAIQLKPDNPITYNNRGNALRDLGHLEEALNNYDKAIQLNADYAEAYSNRGHTLSELGCLNEATQSMQTAIEKAPDNSLISDSLIVLLNHHTPNIDTHSPYVTAQKSLQQINLKTTTPPRITDETVRQLYQQCHSILAGDNSGMITNRSRLYRGSFQNEDCQRHKILFDRFKAIPEHCFGCYKVVMEPKTVMELFKLLLLFNELNIPNDNTRKCTIEVRGEIPGSYKGLIYCQNLNEANEILTSVKKLVSDAISREIPVFIQRGCLEFQLVYPEYGHIADSGPQLMSYNEEWRQHEAHIDKDRGKQTNNNNFVYNHSGLTLLDALVMRNWLAYAKTIGDLSYLQISESHNPPVSDGLKDAMAKRTKWETVT